MSKKISITARPPVVSPEADKWINADRTPDRNPDRIADRRTERIADRKKEPVNKPHAPKRLTIEIEGDTHTRFKVQCAIHKLSMADEIRTMIERRVAELEQRGPSLFEPAKIAQGS